MKYISTKKYKKRASADVSLMFTAYNLRRIISILDRNEFKKYLDVLFLLFLSICKKTGVFRQTDVEQNIITL